MSVANTHTGSSGSARRQRAKLRRPFANARPLGREGGDVAKFRHVSGQREMGCWMGRERGREGGGWKDTQKHTPTQTHTHTHAPR
eukprot:3229195-Rhodomonas_salina.1